MIFILTGPVHSGKTTLLKKVLPELKEGKLRICGFLSEVVLKNDKIIGYDLFDLKEEKTLPFIRRSGEKAWQKIGSFYFIPEGLAEASKIILCGRDADILVVDEVGPLELAGKGLWPALKQALSKPLTNHLLVVRKDILEDFIARLGKSRVKVFDIESKDVLSQIIKEIKRAAYFS